MKEKFIEYAINLAKMNTEEVEVPVGCVVVLNDKIIGYGTNSRETNCDISGHAEINALKMASQHIGDWRLSGCEVYVTLEPCPMCAAALLQSRVSFIFYGSFDYENGALGSKIDLSNISNASRKINIMGGIKQKECDEILNLFFKKLR